MADPDDSRGRGRFSRRKVLGSLAAATGIGTLGGAGTRAILRDTELVPGDLLGNPYSGGNLRLGLECGAGGGDCRIDDGIVAFTFADVEPPASAAQELCLEVLDTPAWLWFRTSGPVTADLGEALTVTLMYGNGEPVYSPDGSAVDGWPLNEVLDAFAAGGRLRGPNRAGAFAAGEGRCFRLAWSLGETSGIAGESIEIRLEFTAVQYLADTTPQNPWGGGSNE